MATNFGDYETLPGVTIEILLKNDASDASDVRQSARTHNEVMPLFVGNSTTLEGLQQILKGAKLGVDNERIAAPKPGCVFIRWLKGSLCGDSLDQKDYLRYDGYHVVKIMSDAALRRAFRREHKESGSLCICLEEKGAETVAYDTIQVKIVTPPLEDYTESHQVEVQRKPLGCILLPAKVTLASLCDTMEKGWLSAEFWNIYFTRSKKLPNRPRVEWLDNYQAENIEGQNIVKRFGVDLIELTSDEALQRALLRETENPETLCIRLEQKRGSKKERKRLLAHAQVEATQQYMPQKETEQQEMHDKRTEYQDQELHTQNAQHMDWTLMAKTQEEFTAYQIQCIHAYYGERGLTPDFYELVDTYLAYPPREAYPGGPIIPGYIGPGSMAYPRFIPRAEHECHQSEVQMGPQPHMAGEQKKDQSLQKED